MEKSFEERNGTAGQCAKKERTGRWKKSKGGTRSSMAATKADSSPDPAVALYLGCGAKEQVEGLT